MNHEEHVRAIVTGNHPDPSAFLGMHESGEQNLLRAFLPGARSVRVTSEDRATLGKLEEIHPEGLFEGPISAEAGEPYRLVVLWNETEEETEIEDPYRFTPLLTDYDRYLFGEGTHHRLYEKLGAHPREIEGIAGTNFAVWAPNASRVSVVGEFNFWDGRRHAMRQHPGGVWEIFVPDVGEGEVYKFEIKEPNGSLLPLKADPFGFYAERSPNTSSIVHDITNYEWNDDEWMKNRRDRNALDSPLAIYEVHLGSWKRNLDGTYYTYEQLADELVPYVAEMGYTHIEFMPPGEYPFDGSWGYQPLGIFAPTSRFGDPNGFRRLVEAFHQAGIGVIADWVPAHFPEDPHGLAQFDGTHLYEHADPRRGRHPDWGTLVFNHGRNEVRNYLISNALFWLAEYHIDALRVDAVASMLYLDYSREPGQWIPNVHGSNEDLEAIEFLKQMNETVYSEHPDAATMAEESTSWPMVSRPTSMGGLGFGYKWNMGWMHDTLAYMREEPMYRSHHHGEITFSLQYAFSENFILPLSHDEVVHGKGSLINKMPGDEWQRFANLRLLYAFMYAHPGKQLLFMGGELAQSREWNHDTGLDWQLLENEKNSGVRALLRDLNDLYRETPALYEVDFGASGFEWIAGGDRENSVLSFIRRGRDRDFAIVVCNFTPALRSDYRIGVPDRGSYIKILDTDAPVYGGSGTIAQREVASEEISAHGHSHSVSLELPPLAAIMLKPSFDG